MIGFPHTQEPDNRGLEIESSPMFTICGKFSPHILVTVLHTERLLFVVRKEENLSVQRGGTAFKPVNEAFSDHLLKVARVRNPVVRFRRDGSETVERSLSY